jgi:hypothetical protein
MVQNERHFRRVKCFELNDIQIRVLAASSSTAALHGAIVMTRPLSLCYLLIAVVESYCI